MKYCFANYVNKVYFDVRLHAHKKGEPGYKEIIKFMLFSIIFIIMSFVDIFFRFSRLYRIKFLYKHIWHIATPNDPVVKFDIGKWSTDMIDWLNENCEYPWRVKGTLNKVYFFSENDLILFKMTWL